MADNITTHEGGRDTWERIDPQGNITLGEFYVDPETRTSVINQYLMSRNGSSGHTVAVTKASGATSIKTSAKMDGDKMVFNYQAHHGENFKEETEKICFPNGSWSQATKIFDRSAQQNGIKVILDFDSGSGRLKVAKKAAHCAAGAVDLTETIEAKDVAGFLADHKGPPTVFIKNW